MFSVFIVTVTEETSRAGYKNISEIARSESPAIIILKKRQLLSMIATLLDPGKPSGVCLVFRRGRDTSCLVPPLRSRRVVFPHQAHLYSRFSARFLRKPPTEAVESAAGAEPVLPCFAGQPFQGEAKAGKSGDGGSRFGIGDFRPFFPSCQAVYPFSLPLETEKTNHTTD
jgi:hypothetical protein